MGSAVALVEVESLTSKLARARKIAHAFVRRRLRLQGERAFEVAESGYAKYEDLRFVEQRDPGLAWLFTVLRRDATRLQSERRRFAAFDELRLVSRELEPPEELEVEDARFGEWRTRFAEIREELEGTLTQDYARLLAYILGGGLDPERGSGVRDLSESGSISTAADRTKCEKDSSEADPPCFFLVVGDVWGSEMLRCLLDLSGGVFDTR